MAATTPVGNVTKMVQILNNSITGKKMEVIYNNDILPFPTTTYGRVYKANRNFFMGGSHAGKTSPVLTQNTYQDTTLITSISAVEQAAE